MISKTPQVSECHQNHQNLRLLSGLGWWFTIFRKLLYERDSSMIGTHLSHQLLKRSMARLRGKHFPPRPLAMYDFLVESMAAPVALISSLVAADRCTPSKCSAYSIYKYIIYNNYMHRYIPDGKGGVPLQPVPLSCCIPYSRAVLSHAAAGTSPSSP